MLKFDLVRALITEGLSGSVITVVRGFMAWSKALTGYLRLLDYLFDAGVGSAPFWSVLSIVLVSRIRRVGTSFFSMEKPDLFVVAAKLRLCEWWVISAGTLAKPVARLDTFF